MIKNYINSRCLKIVEKVSFNIASEASYVYILSGQKFIKNAKMVKTWSLWSNSVTRQVKFIGTKIGENAKIKKLKWDILSSFQTMWMVLKVSISKMGSSNNRTFITLILNRFPIAT